MKDIQSDDIKEIFSKVSVPPIDVKRKVMQKIYDRKEERSMSMRKKLIIGVLISVFLLSSVGFAAMKMWELNGPGNTSYKYQLIDKGDTLPPELYREEYDKLEPGKALAIMTTKNNTKDTISIRLKSVIVESMDELTSKVGDKLKYPAVLPQGYSFKEASYNYKFNDSYAPDMIAESKVSDEDYIFKVLEPTNEVSHYSLTYNNENNNSIFVSVAFDYPSNNIYDINNGHKATKININSFEAIYVEHSGMGEITWLEDQDGSKTYFSIRSINLNKNTRDDLIKIAESLK